MAAQDDKSTGTLRGAKLAVVTPSDATPQPFRFVALHNATATAGTIAITDDDDVAITLYLVAGQVLDCRPKLIKAAGTSVVTIVGFKQ
jgi:hypothetical protein